MLKTFYPLCGSSIPVEPWVQILREGELKTGTTPFDRMISATPWPLRYHHQIPRRWLDSDPGFYILLRGPSTSGTKSWIIGPDNYEFNSLIPFPQDASSVLIITHHSEVFPAWEELQKKFEGKELRWCAYSVKDVPPWPLESYLSPEFLLFYDDWRPDIFFDVNEWQGDTISPLSLHLLQKNIFWQREKSQNLSKKIGKDTYYGEWIIGQESDGLSNAKSQGESLP